MAGISMLNPKAEVARAAQALAVNISAAKGIQDVLKTNLGPKGTMKMLVSGAGDIKITKDGNILLHEMQIQHPTASLIARASTAQVSINISFHTIRGQFQSPDIKPIIEIYLSDVLIIRMMLPETVRHQRFCS